MKKIFFILFIAVTTMSYGQKQPKGTFVLVHGAWSGGWDYIKVDSILRTKGYKVYRPTLTGLGERAHLANANVDLTTHITDIVNVVKFENLHNIILVGHSYAGLVISGVAEQLPERISQLIYLDAMVPNDSESARDVCGDLWEIMMKPMVKDSVVLYPFGVVKPVPPTDVPQSLKTFTEPLRISNPLVTKIPSAFISMTKDGKVDSQIEKMGLARAKMRHWKIYSFEGGHYSMREQPGKLVEKLELVLHK